MTARVGSDCALARIALRFFAAGSGVPQEVLRPTRPASKLIGVRELAIPGMKVEIEAVVGLRQR
jgi:enamine deaminase RidA (YjgF/YER057c/UK114 family)